MNHEGPQEARKGRPMYANLIADFVGRRARIMLYTLLAYASLC